MFARSRSPKPTARTSSAALRPPCCTRRAPARCRAKPPRADTAGSGSMDDIVAARVPAPAIRAFIAQALAAVEVPPNDAARIAELMTEADLTGADAHGVFRLPQYVKRVQAGGFNPRPNITVERTAAATALVDGDNGFGHLVMTRAAQTAIEMAREAGIARVGARRSNHAAPAGLYAAMP